MFYLSDGEEPLSLCLGLLKYNIAHMILLGHDKAFTDNIVSRRWQVLLLLSTYLYCKTVQEPWGFQSGNHLKHTAWSWYSNAAQSRHLSSFYGHPG
jgi:hypothetical protein